MVGKAVALFAVLGACGLDDVETFDVAEQELSTTNGVSLNGVSLNGVSLNGVSLNGVSLNGVSLNGVSLNGVSLNGVSLNGVSLNGVSLNGSSLTGVRSDTGATLSLPVVGTTMTAMLSNGSTLGLKIDSAALLAAPNNDTWSYGVSYVASGTTYALCPGTTALAVAGTWDTRSGVVGGGAYTASTTAFTFACRGMTIAKCVELGYKPWLGRANHLQTCVRLLRGDYCGDGTAYTVTGNTVNLYDSLSVQTDSANWQVEGEWTPAGARCITLARKSRFYDTGVVPTCVANNTLSTVTACGTNFANGALMLSELPLPTKASTTNTMTSSTARAQ